VTGPTIGWRSRPEEDVMDPIEGLADALGIEGPTATETGAILSVARDVAHTMERRITPVSTYLLGISVQRRVAAGASREEAFRAALSDLRAAVPEHDGGDRSEPSG
jgi:Domain of unknown function (DUF6457)